MAAFLAEHPRGVLAWIDRGVGPRQVPVWVAAEGDRLLFNGPTGRTWVTRLRTGPRVSILIADGDCALECWGVVDVDFDGDRARAAVLELTRRVYPDTSRPRMAQDLFRGDRLAVLSVVSTHCPYHRPRPVTGCPRRDVHALVSNRAAAVRGRGRVASGAAAAEEET